MRSFVVLLFLASPAMAAEPAAVPLFNGKDLSGWVNANCAPSTFFVKGNEVVTTGQPIGFLRTERMYENFEMEVEWMHVEKTKMANSGIYLWNDPLPAVGTPFTRGIEVQVLLNYKPADGWATSEGDIFSIWGAKCKPDRPHPKGIERCLPSENRTKPAGEWNHYKIIANDGVVKLHVNGKEVSGVSQCSPRKGYLALESEGVECHFRNMTIKELPSTNPSKEQTATEYAGHKSLFDGLTLTGWTGEGWKVGGEKLQSTGQGDLTTTTKLGKGELIFDWKMPAKSVGEFEILVDGKMLTVKQPPLMKPGTWSRYTIALEGDAAPLTIKASEGLEIMNVFFAAAK
ncbi:family 16 glycoside hydrolase [Limnoglobus roseus]|uniref:Putative beta-jelly-roll-type glycoside hydrolase n=1 Tax=Limnoglobus roseus TaxID=2598579 RepID=A0A5C1A886_9BACT|nr:family 16 glycoside hydrolase [Limnoglobus roseus]QEL14467.1 putative beta-jelly-roll-type glycoside hydrolase [Limnoglobus roseus]